MVSDARRFGPRLRPARAECGLIGTLVDEPAGAPEGREPAEIA
jgi:hypothetical protein